MHNPEFKGRAILLISGSTASTLTTTFLPALEEYRIKINDHQEILMAGRGILAIDFGCDPAHLDYIENDMRAIAKPLHLDIAIEELN